MSSFKTNYKRFQFSWNWNNFWLNFCTATLFLAHANIISADAIIIKEVSYIYIYMYVCMYMPCKTKKRFDCYITTLV
jgi:hypothetical protein